MMMDRITHAPINLYFDMTPISRIMKHFSSDLKAFDMGFLHTIMHGLSCVQVLCYSTYVVMTTVPSLMAIVPLIILKQKTYQADFVKANKNMERLFSSAPESCSKLRKSNYNGLSVIRAFNKTEQCQEEFSGEALKLMQVRRLHTCFHKCNGFN